MKFAGRLDAGLFHHTAAGERDYGLEGPARRKVPTPRKCAGCGLKAEV